MNIHPKPLVQGSRIAIVSPAGPVTPSLLADGISTLNEWGLKVQLDDDLYTRRREASYLAGSDATRHNALYRALSDPEISAVICSRGGYGAMRILPLINPEIIRENPKILVGFSDITALHLYFAGVLGLPTLHGPVVKSFHLHQDDTYQSLIHLRDALFGRRDLPLEVNGLRAINRGVVRGKVLGGNLSIIAHLLSSAFCPDLSGMILILEDVSEEDYRLDRLFTTLRLSEKAKNLGGIVLGDFTNCNGTYVSADSLDSFLEHLARDFPCPVVAGFPCGHGTRNIAVPLGVDAVLDANNETLTFLADAVSRS